jgi:pimeloyl-ACP methyl ester carboxylesterase
VISRNAGIRFVAINRRGYKGSTPISDADKAVFTEGTDAQKAEWLKSRGLEILNFMNTFIVRENLPAISPEGKGGCVLLGWSMGCTFTISAIAYIGDLPSPVQTRLASHLRAHILHGLLHLLFRPAQSSLNFTSEPPAISFGFPTFPAHMIVLGPNISEEARTGIIVGWITSYFQHSGLSTHELSGLSVVPSIIRVPSLWNMSLSEAADMIDAGSYAAFDHPFLLNFIPQANAVYKAAMFDGVVKDRLPHMKRWLLVGDATLTICISALWSVQEDDKARGGGNANYKVLPGQNHFVSCCSIPFHTPGSPFFAWNQVHWDEPKLTVETYMEMLS